MRNSGETHVCLFNVAVVCYLDCIFLVWENGMWQLNAGLVWYPEDKYGGTVDGEDSI